MDLRCFSPDSIKMVKMMSYVGRANIKNCSYGPDDSNTKPSQILTLNHSDRVLNFFVQYRGDLKSDHLKSRNIRNLDFLKVVFKWLDFQMVGL